MAAMHVMAAVRFLEKMQPKLTVQPTCGSPIAKNIVAAKLAKKVEVQLAYAIGVVQPFRSASTLWYRNRQQRALDPSGTGKLWFATSRIIEMLDLRRPIYRQTAAYGHFGRTDIDLPWERTDKVAALLASVKD